MVKMSFGQFLIVLTMWAILGSCSKNEEHPQSDRDPVDEEDDRQNGSLPEPTPVENLDDLVDNYVHLQDYQYHDQWGIYNMHDPSVLNDGDYFYCFSTDASLGNKAPAPGLQVRRSKDLISWQWIGLAFNRRYPTQGAGFIKNHGGTPVDGLWAPYIMKHGEEYRLYYSLASSIPRLSVIGLATSDSPLGPWKEKGLVVTSLNDGALQTNAIDPTVVADRSGKYWMYYGSAWDGIYILELDSSTGLAAKEGDKGVRIAQRGFTGNSINGNIEGPEVIYHAGQDKYYMFIAYDWLETKYNVRVGRSDSPEGPFYDFNGRDLNEAEDNIPMILAPYRFDGHSGWQGVSHPGVFQDNDGQWFMAHQGRLGSMIYCMVFHIRKIFWTEDGWPVVSPERYAAIEQTPVKEDELTGEWEQIVLGYEVVPGYAEEQTSPGFQTSVSLTLDAEGTINGDPGNTWTYEAPWLELNWNDQWIDKVRVHRGRDWENKIDNCLLFSGLNNAGTAIWGKKKN